MEWTDAAIEPRLIRYQRCGSISRGTMMSRSPDAKSVCSSHSTREIGLRRRHLRRSEAWRVADACGTPAAAGAYPAPQNPQLCYFPRRYRIRSPSGQEPVTACLEKSDRTGCCICYGPGCWSIDLDRRCLGPDMSRPGSPSHTHMPRDSSPQCMI